MDRMIENNRKFNANKSKGRAKRKNHNRKLDFIAGALIALIISSGASHLFDMKAASEYVDKRFDTVDLPYHYTISSNGDYFYDNGNYVELSDGLKIIINDLTRQGATLEDIYTYLSNNYGSSMLNVYKDYLKENGEELHLNEYRSKIRADQKFDEVMDKGRSK